MRQSVLITGASRGIGRSCALALSKAGYDIIAVARDISALQKLQQEIQSSTSSKCLVFKVDVANTGNVTQLKKDLDAANCEPDVVINNAGAGNWLFVNETSIEEARRIMDVPFFGAFLITQAFLPDMLKRKSGHFVNISTPASLFPWPGATLYATARWAMTGFTRALRADLNGSGIKVSLLIPGEVSSSYFEHHPGAHARLPWIGKFLPVVTPEQTANKMVKIIKRGCGRDHFFPLSFALLSIFGRIFPTTFQWFITKTGYTYVKHLGKKHLAR